MIPWPTPAKKKKRGRPYVYPPIVMLRCFVVRIWMRIPSNNALHSFFLLSAENRYNARVMEAGGLDRVPDRRTFDRRLRNISTDGSDEDLRPRIDAMGHLFVAEKLIDPYIASEDSTLLKARKGFQWHASIWAGTRPEPQHGCCVFSEAPSKFGWTSATRFRPRTTCLRQPTGRKSKEWGWRDLTATAMGLPRPAKLVNSTSILKHPP